MRHTGEAKAGVFLAALVLGAGLCMGPAAAGEPADDLASWGAVSAAELERHRGGDAEGTAENNASQTATNTIGAGGDVNLITGDVVFGSNTFDNSTMSINAINTGNNVNMQNTLAIVIIID